MTGRSSQPHAQDVIDSPASLPTGLLDLPEELLVQIVCPGDACARAACRRLRCLWDLHRRALKIHVRWPHHRVDHELGRQLTAWLSRLPVEELTYHVDSSESEDGLSLPAMDYKVTAVAPVAACCKLISLRLLERGHVYAALGVQGLGACTLLRTLHLEACLQDIGPLSACVRLESLNLIVAKFSGPVYIAPLAPLTALTSLKIHNSTPIGDVDQVTILASLKQLAITRCLRPLTAFSSLARLEDFSLEDAMLYDVAFLRSCPSLRSLELADCKRLWDVSALASCTALAALRLVRCRRSADVAPLAGCTALTRLTLCECGADWDLAPLGACHWMQVDDSKPAAGLPGGVALGERADAGSSSDFGDSD